MKRVKENFQKPHILIIGAGIIGKFNALELSRIGYQVTIADPAQYKNSSNAALGLLMGNIYQKRSGRSWMLRKQSIELWPNWIQFLQKFNQDLHIEKPLIQLTTNEERFEKLTKFAKQNAKQDLEVLENDSVFIKNIDKIFKTNNLKGIISYRDGRIDPKSLLRTLDIFIENKEVNFIKDEIIKIQKYNSQWVSTTKNFDEIKSEAIILCNSLNALKLINNRPNNIQLKPVLGQAMEIYADEKGIDFLSLPRHFNINGKNILPITKNRIIIGSTDEYNINPNKNFFENLTDFLENKPKWLTKERVSKKWFGIRSRPEGEASPILKNLKERLILCTGFYKNGILLAPACSKWVLNELKKEFD